jgi:hypothetical protein
MTAGLPGFGLGGVFFIISALLAPFGELINSARGRSSRARWVSVGRQLLMAVAMISALEFVGLVSGAGPVQGLSSFSLLPLAATAALLAFVLVTAKLVQLCCGGARRGRRANLARRLLEPLGNTELALAETRLAVLAGADVAAHWRIRRRAGFYRSARHVSRLSASSFVRLRARAWPHAISSGAMARRSGETLRANRPGRSGRRGRANALSEHRARRRVATASA